MFFHHLAMRVQLRRRHLHGVIDLLLHMSLDANLEVTESKCEASSCLWASGRPPWDKMYK